jgi:hypothetical protein
MRPPIAMLTVAGILSLAAAGPTMAQQIQAGGGGGCADYGSFAVVDPPAPPRGAPIVARSWHPCAELPGSAQQPPLYIDAQVQIGGQGSAIGNGQTIGTGSGAGGAIGSNLGGSNLGGPGVSIGVGGLGGTAGGWQRPPDPSFGQGSPQPFVPPGGFTSRVWRR